MRSVVADSTLGRSPPGPSLPPSGCGARGAPRGLTHFTTDDTLYHRHPGSAFNVFDEGKGEHGNCVLLLDEPGHSLHPLAQRDLSAFFEGLSENNQIPELYSSVGIGSRALPSGPHPPVLRARGPAFRHLVMASPHFVKYLLR